MAEHPDEKGLIHAHSYDIAGRLTELLGEFGVAARVRRHDRANRDAELAAWKASDDPEVFVSVKMEEALDLKGDLCRWQVVCKAPYRNTNDSRVARRLADDQWAWYHRTALRTVIQACGRVVRAPDDYGDDVPRGRLTVRPLRPREGRHPALVPRPDRRDDDADAARLRSHRRARRDRRRAERSVTGGPSWRNGPVEGRPGAAWAEAGASRAAAASHAGDSTVRRGGDGRPGRTTGGGTTRTRSEADAERRENHPLSDIWGDG